MRQSVKSTRAATDLSGDFNKLSISSDTESDAECPNCELMYSEDEAITWIHCDQCNTWFDLGCAGISADDIPSVFSVKTAYRRCLIHRYTLTT